MLEAEEGGVRSGKVTDSSAFVLGGGTTKGNTWITVGRASVAIFQDDWTREGRQENKPAQKARGWGWRQVWGHLTDSV